VSVSGGGKRFVEMKGSRQCPDLFVGGPFYGERRPFLAPLIRYAGSCTLNTFHKASHNAKISRLFVNMLILFCRYSAGSRYVSIT
jgi:hypothetical protein